MKYIGMPMGMWVLFGKSFERNLVTGIGLDRDTAKMTAAKAKPRYKEIIAGLPEFEKSDRFKMNIVNCALLSAFVLSMPERPDVKRLTGKNLITIGIFSAIYFVINFAFMLMTAKVQKPGAVFLMGLDTALIYFATAKFTFYGGVSYAKSNNFRF